MLFKMPSTVAILMLATFVFGGIGLAYLPTQISDTASLQGSWQARWGPEISTIGILVVVLATVAFVGTHIKWPSWVIALKSVRVRLFKAPYYPDTFLADARQRLSATLVVVKKTVQVKPHGWDLRDPFIRITYYIHNGSPFPVRFDNVTGEFRINESVLHDPPVIHEGHGQWGSGATAQLQIDQRLKRDFWKQLKEGATKDWPVSALHGGVTVRVSSEAREFEETRISLTSDSPFLTS